MTKLAEITRFKFRPRVYNAIISSLHKVGFEDYLSNAEMAILTNTTDNQYGLMVVDIWEDGALEIYAQRQGIDITPLRDYLLAQGLQIWISEGIYEGAN